MQSILCVTDLSKQQKLNGETTSETDGRSMDTVKYRAWVYERQGLGAESGLSARESLAKHGWQRSVGGANPYLALQARTGVGRAEVDALAARLELFELPSARACTYVLPADHFALGLALARMNGSTTEVNTARRLGVPDEEIDALKQGVIDSLQSGPLDPVALRAALGDKVRSLGDEGKKKGLTTTLPVALGVLQSEGVIRRKPSNGRLDTQRYAYELWNPALTESVHSVEPSAPAEIARLYFSWIGAATMQEFRDFAAFSAKMTKQAIEEAELVSFDSESDLFCLPGVREEYEAFEIPNRPRYRLVGNLDTFLMLRRGVSFWLDDSDRHRSAPTDKGLKEIGGFGELWSHAILDRGRLIGIWEFDPDAGEIVACTWVPQDDALKQAIQSAQACIRDELQDVRSFSLDSPASRQPRLQALRDLGKG